ncbi:hypothetical protein LSH36_162g02029 [Paralvinella palmiformis]|uniref:Uncharacterized protein n=1 Tax=Paralvinella palmiformis TaxID=53620 RepID=A0AAD9JTR0_9ANNE|nr:hypothetical protein LSH36_162g02029 [Paralvinella palmiformis]
MSLAFILCRRHFFVASRLVTLSTYFCRYLVSNLQECLDNFFLLNGTSHSMTSAVFERLGHSNVDEVPMVRSQLRFDIMLRYLWGRKMSIYTFELKCSLVRLTIFNI